MSTPSALEELGAGVFGSCRAETCSSTTTTPSHVDLAQFPVRRIHLECTSTAPLHLDVTVLLFGHFGIFGIIPGLGSIRPTSTVAVVLALLLSVRIAAFFRNDTIPFSSSVALMCMGNSCGAPFFSSQGTVYMYGAVMPAPPRKAPSLAHLFSIDIMVLPLIRKCLPAFPCSCCDHFASSCCEACHKDHRHWHCLERCA